MAYNYYSKEKLVKVGMEFAMVDDQYLGRKGARVNAPQRQPPPPPQGPQVLCSKEKLLKVGKEGFAMVDECLGRKGARLNAPQRPPPPQPILCRYQYQPQESHVYVVTQFSSPTKDNVRVCFGLP